MEVIELIGKTLYQWDTGRQVSINPPEGITVDEVHFAGRNDAVALVVAPKTAEEGIVADIPNIFLQKSTGIRMWAVMRYPDGSERTVSTNSEIIISRAKPEDYVYTETEVQRYETLEERIEELEKNGIGVQSDLSQNDAEAPDYVKNRTHWKDPGGASVLEETTITIDEDGLGSVVEQLSLVIGNTYNVIYNGVTYSCVTTVFNGASVLGNSGAVTGGEDTGEPFVLIYIDEGRGLIMTLDGTVSTDITLSITEGDTYHALPNEYLNFIKNTGNKAIVRNAYDKSANDFEKVSNKCPCMTDLNNGGSITLTYSDGTKKVIEFTESDIIVDESNLSVYHLRVSATSGGMTVTRIMAMFVQHALGDYEIGTYLWKGGTNYYPSKLIVNGFSFEEEKIAEDYIPQIPESKLPDSVDSVIIRSSTKDSTKKFKISVDDTGTITATEVT